MQVLLLIVYLVPFASFVCVPVRMSDIAHVRRSVCVFAPQLVMLSFLKICNWQLHFAVHHRSVFIPIHN